MLPKAHGLAYRNWTDAGAVTMVIPMNIIVAWSRRFYQWLRFEVLPGASRLEQVRRDAYAAGHRAGMILEGERTGKLLSSSYRKSTVFRRYGNVVERGEAADVEYEPSGIGGGR